MNGEPLLCPDGAIPFSRKWDKEELAFLINPAIYYSKMRISIFISNNKYLELLYL